MSKEYEILEYQDDGENGDNFLNDFEKLSFINADDASKIIEILDPDELSSKLIKSFLSSSHLVSSQTDGYNAFINNCTSKILATISGFTLFSDEGDYNVELGNPIFLPPVVTKIDRTKTYPYPVDCIQQKRAYTSDHYIDISITYTPKSTLIILLTTLVEVSQHHLTKDAKAIASYIEELKSRGIDEKKGKKSSYELPPLIPTEEDRALLSDCLVRHRNKKLPLTKEEIIDIVDIALETVQNPYLPNNLKEKLEGHLKNHQQDMELTDIGKLRLNKLTLFLKSKDDNSTIEKVNEHTNKITKFIGKIPVMVGSCLCNTVLRCSSREEIITKANHCPDDYGGYFIINGTKRILVAQEASANNILAVHENRKKKPKYDKYITIRSAFPNTVGVATTTTHIGIQCGRISALLPYMSETGGIPICILFRALGAKSNEEIRLLIDPSGEDKEISGCLLPSIAEGYEIQTAREALYFIGSNKKKFTGTIHLSNIDQESIDDGQSLLENNFVPHVGKNLEKKKYYLGYVVRRLLDVYLKRRTSDDRDHYANKIMQGVQILLSEQYHSGMQKVRTEIKSSLESFISKGVTRTDIPVVSIKPATLTNAMVGCVGNNSWNKRNTKSVSQVMDSQTSNRSSYFSNMRKLAIQMGEGGGGAKIFAPREVHGSAWGFVCSVASPEGKNTGLLKQMTTLTKITCGSEPNVIIEILGKMNDVIVLETFDGKMTPGFSVESLRGASKITLNGDWVAITTQPKNVRANLLQIRRSGGMSPDVSIASVPGELKLSTEPGRLVRPVLIVKNGRLMLRQEDLLPDKNESKKRKFDYLYDENYGKTYHTFYPDWYTLLFSGKMELIDPAEQDTADIYIALNPNDLNTDHSHCEITPSIIFGVSAALLPYPDHNQAPRNTYGEVQSKQSISAVEPNIYDVMTGTTNVLNEPQIPLVRTQFHDLAEFGKFPCGQNAVVGIQPFLGRNQEDSICINQSSIERGMFDSTRLYLVYTEIRKGDGEILDIPELANCPKGFHGNSKNLSTGDPLKDGGKKYVRGICPPGTVVEHNDVIVGKVKELLSVDGEKTYSDESVLWKEKFPARIHRVQLGIAASGAVYVRVIVGQRITPISGNKFASRFGQKGTVGIAVPEIDFPFPANPKSSRPELIMTPQAFPSRMTISHLIEMLAGKRICAPVCSTMTMESLRDILENGDKRVYFITKNNNQSKDEDGEVLFDDDGTPTSCLTSEILGENVVDATPFRPFSITDIIRELRDAGFPNCGDEVFYDGMTGEPMKTLIFTGVVYYQALKHLVLAKYHTRGTFGPITALCRQPVEGRGFGGGLRIGWMERDCIAAAGAAHVLKDRMFDCSDPSKMWICSICGLPATVSEELKIRECRVCKTTNVYCIKIPYATGLIARELNILNIYLRFPID